MFVIVQSLLSVLSGLLSGSAFNNFSGVNLHHTSSILMLLGFALFGAILQYCPRRKLHAYLFGLAFHTVSLSWVGYSLEYTSLPYLRYLVGFALAIPLALFPCLSVWLTEYICGKKYFSILLWVIIFAFTEWVRLQSPFGLPWNLVGFCGPFFSSVRIWGVLGLSLFVLLVSQVFLLTNFLRIMLCLFAIALTIDSILWYRQEPAAMTPYTVRLVQPCIAQEKKWDITKLEENLTKIASLSNPNPNLDAVIWSESALPVLNISMLAKFLELGQTILILGHVRIDDDKKYVSLSAVNGAGDILSTYNKQFLIPFGEYVPFNLPVRKITKDFLEYAPGDFSPGEKSQTFTPHPLPSAISLICFETIFPQVFKGNGSWILIVTNDTWFGTSVGPYQHLQWARIRAIENNKPVIRVANNGISAVINGHGQILNYIPHNHCDFLDTQIPEAGPETLFAKFGHMIFFAILILLWFYDIRLRSKKNAKKILWAHKKPTFKH